MTILSAIGAWILGVLSKDFLSWVSNLVLTTWNNYKASKAVSDQASADANQLANATTTQEKTDAANQINQDTFGSGPTA